MGGSLGLALRRLGLAEVSAYARREETRRLAIDLGAVDLVYDSPLAALRGAEMAVFCTPVCSMPELARDCLPAFEPGCVVTDVGSTKADLVRAMDNLFQGSGVVFVGSHPMAGSERTGMEAARTDLYEGAVTAVTPGTDTPEAAVRQVMDLWGGVGARVVRLDPVGHDGLVARTSHLPHLIAALLVCVAARAPVSPELALFCGPGFRDTTRIAGGSPEMWHDIVKTNSTAILEELRRYGSAVNDLCRLIESQEYEGVRDCLEQARRIRSQLLEAQP